MIICNCFVHQYHGGTERLQECKGGGLRCIYLFFFFGLFLMGTLHVRSFFLVWSYLQVFIFSCADFLTGALRGISFCLKEENGFYTIYVSYL